MARTATENSAWWLEMAARYDRQAEAATTPHGHQKWTDRALLARSAATKSFLSPAPSEAESPA